MEELIKELENNQKINIEKGLENRVDIAYIIDRLKNINTIWEYVRGEVLFNIESLVNENYMDYDKECKMLESMTDDDINKITEAIYSQDWLFDVINENMNDAIQKELANYINKK